VLGVFGGWGVKQGVSELIKWYKDFYK